MMAVVGLACSNDYPEAVENVEFKPMLSEYNIYRSPARELIPADGFSVYELSSQLFTDYAEKQRLISIPRGTQLQVTDDNLPEFPDSTVIVKTFYYPHDKRDLSRGKRIIETRLLVKHGPLWNAATYVWNEDQTDAELVRSGLNTTVNWVDESGHAQVISYHVPSTLECATCHSSRGAVTPIGPKSRNLNRTVHRNGEDVNQLDYFRRLGLLTAAESSMIGTVPDHRDNTIDISQRARSYLDINCAHCHNSEGFARDLRLRLDYGADLNNTAIPSAKDAIVRMMEKGKMPKLGTTVIDEDGLTLVKQYIKTL